MYIYIHIYIWDSGHIFIYIYMGVLGPMAQNSCVYSRCEHVSRDRAPNTYIRTNHNLCLTPCVLDEHMCSGSIACIKHHTQCLPFARVLLQNTCVRPTHMVLNTGCGLCEYMCLVHDLAKHVLFGCRRNYFATWAPRLPYIYIYMARLPYIYIYSG